MALLEVGLTGGIASGKSTVDAILERLGAHIIDADLLVHDLLQPGMHEHERVVQRFGTGVVDRKGRVDRKALARIVFADDAARADLNAILHPAVRREETRIKDALASRGGGVVITDAALLVETGRHRDYQRLIVVACDPGLQLTRLLARDGGLSADEARSRLAAQAPLEAKVSQADYVIDTSGSMAETEARAHAVYQRLVEDLDRLRRGEELPDRDA